MRTDPILLHTEPGPLMACLPDPDPGLVAEHAVALANTDGGSLLISSTLDDAALESALREAGQKCTPLIAFDHYERLDNGYTGLIAIRIPRGLKVHALSDGRVLARTGDHNRTLNGTEIRQLVSLKNSGDFEADVVPGAKPGDLDPDLIAQFMIQRAARLRRRVDADGDDWLIEMGAVTPDHQITVAGMLLFGREPQQWIPQSQVRFTRYITKDVKAREDTMGGALIPLFDQMWDLVRSQIKPDDYPAGAVREALINALCHRDYRLRTKRIEIRQFPDRLEISSPGGLPGFITRKQLGNGRFSRNPRLTWALYHWGTIDQPGAGIQQMIRSMEQHGLQPPQFESHPYQVLVRLYTNSIEAPAPVQTDFTDCQRDALAYVQEHGSVNARQLRALCSGSKPDEIQRDLAELVERGMLRQMAARTSSYYILP
jgi:ATP-dependent DNA helicase RecG